MLGILTGQLPSQGTNCFISAEVWDAVPVRKILSSSLRIGLTTAPCIARGESSDMIP